MLIPLAEMWDLSRLLTASGSSAGSPTSEDDSENRIDGFRAILRASIRGQFDRRRKDRENKKNVETPESKRLERVQAGVLKGSLPA